MPLGKGISPSEIQSSGTESMERTEAYRVLTSADRQLVLHELVESNGAVAIDDLSRRVAARRHRISPDQISDTKTQRARVRLVHTHFPLLRDKKVITVDWDTRQVSLTSDENREHLFEAAKVLDSWPPDDFLCQSIS
nr:hypothetical protein [Halovivax sp. KZCA124]